ncbi:hypothetical protein R1sor_008502 [Riccia sorocarpa]|uniref:Peroxidase n=1 Tax=Riccia sorocarpa TaxID=122646 RepID=A0ABD3HVQ9_9MARC
MGLLQLRCLLLFAIAAITGSLVRGYGLSESYYQYTCPQAEAVIQKAVFDELNKDSEPAPGVLRLQLHDCFVEGCDGSVLLDGPYSEKTADANSALDGFEIIDIAKAAVEAVCPGVVSCADVLAYAVRDSVLKMGGEYWEVEAGRKDGIRSDAAQAELYLPSPHFSVTQLIDNFAKKGLSAEQMVILSGAHTVGSAHCDKFVNRLYNYNEEYYTDPTIDPVYADYLRQQCPQTYDNSTEVDNDAVTPELFDSNYYVTLQENKGLFSSDQALLWDDRTSNAVNSLAQDHGKFTKKFGEAMRALAAIEVKTGDEGEIRRCCHEVNH